MLGILSDAHGNRPAFDLAIDLLKDSGADRFVFLGDALGYLPTTDVIESIRSLEDKISCLRGNHEEDVLNNALDTSREPVYQHDVTRRLLTDTQTRFVRSWGTSWRLGCEAGSVLFVHGSPTDPLRGYVYPDTDLNTFGNSEQFVFMGHTHRPFVRKLQDTTFVNVGSCGLPRDHGTLGAAALFDEQTGAIRLIRFEIGNTTERALSKLSSVHPSVLSLFGRVSQSFEGELIVN